MPFAYDLLEPGLAISAAPESAGELAGLPFEAILNVADWGSPRYAAGLCPDLHLVWRPFEDSVPAPLPFLTEAVLELAELRRRKLATLVHCQHGQSRSPAVIALYWMARDRISWEQAIARIVKMRSRVEPHPQLTSERTRNVVVELVRALLAGDGSVLHQWRRAALELLQADGHRASDESPHQGNWDLIEERLALGAYPDALNELLDRGFDRFLHVTSVGGRVPYIPKLPRGAEAIGFSLREDEPVDPEVVAGIVAQLRHWLDQGRRVYLHDQEGRSPAALVVCLYLMGKHGWDAGSALWYLRRRRSTASTSRG